MWTTWQQHAWSLEQRLAFLALEQLGQELEQVVGSERRRRYPRSSSTLLQGRSDRRGDVVAPMHW